MKHVPTSEIGAGAFWHGIAGTCLFVALFAAWVWIRPGDDQFIGLVDNLAQLLAFAVAALLCFGVYEWPWPARAGTGLATGRSWRTAQLLLGASALSYVVAQMFWTVYTSVYQDLPLPSWADLFFLGSYPLLLLAFLALPGRRLSSLSRVRIALDGGLVLAAAASISWYFLIGPAILNGTATVSAKVVGAAYPLADIVVLLCLFLLMARISRETSRRAIALLAAGLLVHVIADVIYSFQTINGTYAVGTVLDVGWPAGALLLSLGTYLLRPRPTSARGFDPPEHLSSVEIAGGSLARWASWAPYASFTLVELLLLLALTNEGERQIVTGVYVGAAILVALVLMRQALAFFENQRLTDTLEQRVSERTAQLEATATDLRLARDAAVAASRTKSEFLANMSHEIRTPMNAILGMAELLAETSLSAEQRDYVATSQRAGDTLLRLIDDILDFSKVEAGQLQLERVSFELEELLDGTAEILALRAHGKGLELVVHPALDLPQQLLGDPGRLRQVLTNLLGNAIKFTAAGEVGLRVEHDLESTSPGAIRFTVWDSGIGIPLDKQALIFESFTQADASTTRQYGGTGLGLAICRRLVELMGGRLWVESTPGQGARFVFTALFDLAPLPAARPVPTVLDLQGSTVLVIDDNPTNRLVLRQTLTAHGARVREAEDGEQGLAAFREARHRGDPFRLVLLDRRMPHLDGFQVAEQLEREDSARDACIIMLTSESRAGDVTRARELGLAAHLLKPIKRTELLATLARVISPRAETPLLSPASDSAVESRPLRLLLVEDSIDNRALIQAFLKKLPYAIEIAENGQEAIERFREGSYDLVLMDMLMPVLDGLEATRAMRAWERQHGHAPTPVLALSANAMPEHVELALAAGCTAHVAKPVKKAVLLEAIAQHVHAGTSELR